MRDNKVIIISGGTCSGKNFITDLLIRNFNSELIVSSTTRNIRTYDNEINGVHYHFISTQDFIKKIKSNDFIEYEKVHDNYYGTEKVELERIIGSNKTPVAIVDPLGNRNLKSELSKLGYSPISVFVHADYIVRSERLVHRLNKAIESSDIVQANDTIKRMKKSFEVEQEWINAVNYDIILINNKELDVSPLFSNGVPLMVEVADSTYNSSSHWTKDYLESQKITDESKAFLSKFITIEKNNNEASPCL